MRNIENRDLDSQEPDQKSISNELFDDMDCGTERPGKTTEPGKERGTQTGERGKRARVRGIITTPRIHTRKQSKTNISRSFSSHAWAHILYDSQYNSSPRIAFAEEQHP